MKYTMIALMILASACGTADKKRFLDGSVAYMGSWSQSQNAADWLIMSDKTISSSSCGMTGRFAEPDSKGLTTFVFDTSNNGLNCPKVGTYVCHINFYMSNQNLLGIVCGATIYDLSR
jgi:hypothetical protein